MSSSSNNSWSDNESFQGYFPPWWNRWQSSRTIFVFEKRSGMIKIPLEKGGNLWNGKNAWKQKGGMLKITIVVGFEEDAFWGWRWVYLGNVVDSHISPPFSFLLACLLENSICSLNRKALDAAESPENSYAWLITTNLLLPAAKWVVVGNQFLSLFSPHTARTLPVSGLLTINFQNQIKWDVKRRSLWNLASHAVIANLHLNGLLKCLRLTSNLFHRGPEIIRET